MLAHAPRVTRCSVGTVDVDLASLTPGADRPILGSLGTFCSDTDSEDLVATLSEGERSHLNGSALLAMASEPRTNGIRVDRVIFAFACFRAVFTHRVMVPGVELNPDLLGLGGDDSDLVEEAVSSALRSDLSLDASFRLVLGFVIEHHEVVHLHFLSVVVGRKALEADLELIDR